MADRRLQVFITVAKILSFTKAAEVLHMTQPAVTFQVRQLEEYFNTRLFDRTHNKVTLTEAGKTVQSYAERIFVLYNEMEGSVKEVTGDISSALTVGASTTVAEYMLPALLGKFKSRYPDVRLSLKVSNTDGVVSMVENNVIDLAVVEAPVNNKHLIVESCLMDQLIVAVHPTNPIAKMDNVNVKELLKYSFICREEGSGTREVIHDYLVAQGAESDCLSMCLELGSPESIKGAVEAGMGVSILSKVTIAKELKLGTLAAVPLDPPLERPFSFVRQRQKFRQRATEELLEFAHDYCREHQQ
ncbi:MAG TPA: LysR family transcriptional regulator [Gammaproteobacteria bacterium]|nr:LysR family transcriptional regulator [Gammaproteobacteria bacterium]